MFTTDRDAKIKPSVIKVQHVARGTGSDLWLERHVSGRVKFLINCIIHTHTQLSWTTQVGRYQKKHSPTHTHPVHQTSYINFLHLLRSTASSLFSSRAWQSFSATSVQVIFGLPLGLEPSTPYISSPNHHLAFATHAHTIAACFAAERHVSRNNICITRQH